MSEIDRTTARELARRHVSSGDPLGWFEVLYAAADGDFSSIPWADLSPNPNLVQWLDEHRVDGTGRRALKVGCGLGDDAEELSHRGFDTTAFDISPTAIAWCARRFPASNVRYVEADLLRPPAEWAGAFDFVVESYTLQVLPPELRQQAIRNVAQFVAPGGTLLVISRAREPHEAEGAMPWPLTRNELDAFGKAGLSELRVEDYVDGESPPVRRFRAEYLRRETFVDIGRVRESDLEAISQLHVHFWDTPSDVIAMSETLRVLADDPDHLFLAARMDGRCIGTATGVVCHGLYGGFDAYLVVEDVVVDEAHRRRGVASALVRELERFARENGCRQMVLLSESVRTDAQGLYETLGFESRWTGFKKKLEAGSGIGAGHVEHGSAT